MFQLWILISLIPLEVQGHALPHLKARSSGKYELRGLNCGWTFNICQCILKIENPLHKQSLVETHLIRTVKFITFIIDLKNKRITILRPLVKRGAYRKIDYKTFAYLFDLCIHNVSKKNTKPFSKFSFSANSFKCATHGHLVYMTDICYIL